MATTQTEMVALLKENRNEGYRQLTNRYKHVIEAICRKRLEQQQDQEDVVQEILILVYRKIHLFDSSKGTFQTWLFCISGRYCMQVNRLRRNKARTWRRICEAMYYNYPPGIYDKPVTEFEKWANAACRNPILMIMHYVEERSKPQIARIFGMTTRQVENRIREDKKRMQKMYPHLRWYYRDEDNQLTNDQLRCLHSSKIKKAE